ncbi:MAG: hypothetical protein RBS39_10435 [Phycisphaerales bacterium]|nr:hypothetical protein [Phycisphaerales bacterium]
MASRAEQATPADAPRTTEGGEVASREGSLLPPEEGSREVLGPSWLSPLLMFLSVAVLMGTLIRRHKIVRKRAALSAVAPDVRAGDVPRDRPAWSGSAAGDMTTLMADFEELAERLAAQLDNKAERLEQLLGEAERVMGELDSRLSSPTAHASHAAVGTTPRGPARSGAGRYEHADDEAREPGLPSSHRRVHELADSGLSPVDIARETGTPVGQVELILNLRRS